MPTRRSYRLRSLSIYLEGMNCMLTILRHLCVWNAATKDMGVFLATRKAVNFALSSTQGRKVSFHVDYFLAMTEFLDVL